MEKSIKEKFYKVSPGKNSGILTGYAATWKKDNDGDICRRGCFREFIENMKKEGRVIPLLFNHEARNLRYYIGTIYELKEDYHGLKFTGSFDDTPEAQKARTLAKDGRLKGVSFSYEVLEQGPVKLPDGTRANELRKLNIYEISLTPYPANREAVVTDVKGTETREQKTARLLLEATRLLNK